MWKEPFTPVHSKWERKGLILPRSSSSQRKHHRLSEMRSYKNSLTLQAECSGRTESPSSVLTDAQCLLGAEATTMFPVQMVQALLISLWCTFFLWCRDKNSASYGAMCTNWFERVCSCLAKPTRTIPALTIQPSPCSPIWKNPHGIIVKRTVRGMQKCARAYLQLSV